MSDQPSTDTGNTDETTDTGHPITDNPQAPAPGESTGEEARPPGTDQPGGRTDPDTATSDEGDEGDEQESTETPPRDPWTSSADDDEVIPPGTDEAGGGDSTLNP